MVIRCEHVHRLELRKLLEFCVVHLSEKREIRTKFNFGHVGMSRIRNTRITDKRGFRRTCYIATATQNLKDFRISSL